MGPAAGGPVRRGDADSQVLRLRRPGLPEFPRPGPVPLETRASTTVSFRVVQGIHPNGYALPTGESTQLPPCWGRSKT